MFFDTFKKLCDRKGVSCKKAVIDMGLSNSIATKWKNTGAIPNGETLNKIADYFDISVDDLFQRNYPSNVEVYDKETGKWVAQKRYNKIEQKEKAPISDEDLKIALWGHGKISDRALKTVRDYAAFVEEREREEEDENSK